jgi:hypothetical protein
MSSGDRVLLRQVWTALLTCVLLRFCAHPRSVQYMRVPPKANSYVQPSIFDMLAGASPASARDGWAE